MEYEKMDDCNRLGNDCPSRTGGAAPQGAEEVHESVLISEKEVREDRRLRRHLTAVYQDEQTKAEWGILSTVVVSPHGSMIALPVSVPLRRKVPRSRSF